MKRVVIVPGHSFKDPGAVNDKLGITEYEYCLKTAVELFEEEEWEDIDLILKSRNKNYSNLPGEINHLNPDLVLELHLNAANGSAKER